MARLGFLALDRPDTQFAVKEAAKRMSAPHAPDMQLLKRLGRYLKGAPRAVQLFRWQETLEESVAYVDSIGPEIEWAESRRAAA